MIMEEFSILTAGRDLRQRGSSWHAAVSVQHSVLRLHCLFAVEVEKMPREALLVANTYREDLNAKNEC
jgi:hypothetical protein